MANWIKTDAGNVVNLDHFDEVRATQVGARWPAWRVVAVRDGRRPDDDRCCELASGLTKDAANQLVRRIGDKRLRAHSIEVTPHDRHPHADRKTS